MTPTGDELAGVVDLFGALAPDELRRAIDEIAFKRGEEASDLPIEAAIENYRLVAIDATDAIAINDEPEAAGTIGGDRLLAVGPTAFPALPTGGEDLPHILDIGRRTVPDDRLAGVVERRFRVDATRAIGDNDGEAIADLLDVSYALESWGPPLDLETTRERLDNAAG